MSAIGLKNHRSAVFGLRAGSVCLAGDLRCARIDLARGTVAAAPDRGR